MTLFLNSQKSLNNMLKNTRKDTKHTNKDKAMEIHQCHRKTTYSDTIWPSTSLPPSFSPYDLSIYSSLTWTLFCLYVSPSRQLLHPIEEEVNIQHLCLWKCTHTFNKVQLSWNSSWLHAFWGQRHTVSKSDTLITLQDIMKCCVVLDMNTKWGSLNQVYH